MLDSLGLITFPDAVDVYIRFWYSSSPTIAVQNAQVLFDITARICFNFNGMSRDGPISGHS